MMDRQRSEELWGIVLDCFSAIDDEIENLNAMRARYVQRFRAFCGAYGEDQEATEKLLDELSKKIAEIE